MAKLFFIGDSITFGSCDERGGWANRLIGQIMGRMLEAEKTGDSFLCAPHNLGICGNTVEDAIDRLKNEVQARIDPEQPEEPLQIVFALGTNDSAFFVDKNQDRYTDEQFENNLRTMTKIARTFTDNISFLGLLPVDESLLSPVPWNPNKAYKNETLKRFEEIIQKHCETEQLPFLPLYDEWFQMPDYQKHFTDGLHPNTEGHAMMAQKIGDFLFTETFTDFHTCSD